MLILYIWLQLFKNIFFIYMSAGWSNCCMSGIFFICYLRTTTNASGMPVFI